MTQATNTSLGEIKLAGDLAGNNNALSPELTASGVTPGTFTVPTLTVNSKGIITAASNSTSAAVAALVPDATTSTKGVVQVGSGLSVSSGVISATAIPDATTSVKGLVQVGSGLAVSSGVLSVPDATTSTKGVVQAGSGISISSGVISATSAADATTSTKGIVQIGTGLSVSSGVVSASTATSGNVGVCRPGAGLNISSGVISVDNSVYARKTEANTFQKAITFGPFAASSLSSLVGDESNVITFTATSNFTLNNFSSAASQVGAFIRIIVTQDATGGHLITWGSNFKFVGGVTPTLSTAPNAVDVINVFILNSTTFLTIVDKNFV